MSRHLTIDQKIQQIFLVLLGVVDGVTSNKEAMQSIETIVNGKPNGNYTKTL